MGLVVAHDVEVLVPLLEAGGQVFQPQVNLPVPVNYYDGTVNVSYLHCRKHARDTAIVSAQAAPLEKVPPDAAALPEDYGVLLPQVVEHDVHYQAGSQVFRTAGTLVGGDVHVDPLVGGVLDHLYGHTYSPRRPKDRPYAANRSGPGSACPRLQ